MPLGLSGEQTADGNRDDLVDAADYTVWQDSLIVHTASSKSSPQGVPEPATCAFLVELIAIGIVGFRYDQSKLSGFSQAVTANGCNSAGVVIGPAPGCWASRPWNFCRFWLVALQRNLWVVFRSSRLQVLRLKPFTKFLPLSISRCIIGASLPGAFFEAWIGQKECALRDKCTHIAIMCLPGEAALSSAGEQLNKG